MLGEHLQAAIQHIRLAGRTSPHDTDVDIRAVSLVVTLVDQSLAVRALSRQLRLAVHQHGRHSYSSIMVGLMQDAIQARMQWDRPFFTINHVFEVVGVATEWARAVHVVYLHRGKLI